MIKQENSRSCHSDQLRNNRTFQTMVRQNESICSHLALSRREIGPTLADLTREGDDSLAAFVNSRHDCAGLERIFCTFWAVDRRRSAVWLTARTAVDRCRMRRCRSAKLDTAQCVEAILIAMLLERILEIGRHEYSAFFYSLKHPPNSPGSSQ